MHSALDIAYQSVLPARAVGLITRVHLCVEVSKSTSIRGSLSTRAVALTTGGLSMRWKSNMTTSSKFRLNHIFDYAIDEVESTVQI